MDINELYDLVESHRDSYREYARLEQQSDGSYETWPHAASEAWSQNSLSQWIAAHHPIIHDGKRYEVEYSPMAGTIEVRVTSVS